MPDSPSEPLGSRWFCGQCGGYNDVDEKGCCRDCGMEIKDVESTDWNADA